MKKDSILEIKKLVKVYKMGKNLEVLALDNVGLEIKKGEIVVIMGPSGSGKSTLLNMLGILDRPISGYVRIGKDDISKLSKNRMPEIRSQKIGFIFQQYNLIPTLTALENVMLPLKYTGIKKDKAKKAAHKVLREVGMRDREDHRPTELSGGQQQRVAIARALVNNPDIILADEPTGNLDTKTGNQIVDMIKRFNKEKKQTFVIVTHNPEITKVADRVVSIRDGKLYKGSR